MRILGKTGQEGKVVFLYVRDQLECMKLSSGWMKIELSAYG